MCSGKKCCSCCKIFLCMILCLLLLTCNAVNLCINVFINSYHKTLTSSLNSDIFVTFLSYFVNGIVLIVLNSVSLHIRNKRKFQTWDTDEDGVVDESGGQVNIERKKFLKVKACWSKANEATWQEAIKYFKDNENAQFHLFQPGFLSIYFHHIVVTNIRVVVDQDNINSGQEMSSSNTEPSNVHEDIQDVVFEYTDYDGHKVDIEDIIIHSHKDNEVISEGLNDVKCKKCKKCCFNFRSRLICLWSCPVAGVVTVGNRILLSNLLHKDLYVRKIGMDKRKNVADNIKFSIGDIAYDAAYNNCEHYAHQIIGETRESKQLTTMGTHASYYVLNAFGPFAKVNTSRKLFSYLVKFFLYFAYVIVVSIIVDLSNYNDPKPFYISTLVCSAFFEIVHFVFEMFFLCRSKIAKKYFTCCPQWFPITLKLILSSLIMFVAVNGGAMLGSLIFENLPLFIGEFFMSSFCCITAAIFFSPIATVYVDFLVFTACNKRPIPIWCKCLLFAVLLVVVALPLILASFAMLAVILDGMFFTFDCYGLCPWATTIIVQGVSYIVVLAAFVTNLFAIGSLCRNLPFWIKSDFCKASSENNQQSVLASSEGNQQGFKPATP